MSKIRLARPKSHLVGIADAVGAIKTIVGEQVVIGVGGNRCVEVGNVILIFVGCIQEVKSRLEGLPPLTIRSGVALKNQAAIDTECRQGPAQGITIGIVFQLVIRKGQLQLRLEEIPAVFRAHSKGRNEMGAIPGNAVIAVETGPFEVDRCEQISLQNVGVGIEAKSAAGCCKVGRYRRVVVQGIIVLHQQFAAPEFFITIQAQIAFEMIGIAVLRGDCRKIKKKVLVRDFGEQHARLQVKW